PAGREVPPGDLVARRHRLGGLFRLRRRGDPHGARADAGSRARHWCDLACQRLESKVAPYQELIFLSVMLPLFGRCATGKTPTRLIPSGRVGVFFCPGHEEGPHPATWAERGPTCTACPPSSAGTAGHREAASGAGS